MVGEADPVAEERALRERARGIDRDHAHGAVVFAHVADERADQRRLADPGRAGDPDGVGAAGLRVELLDHLVGERLGVLNEGDCARERPLVTGANACSERFPRELAARSHERMLDRRGGPHDAPGPY